MVGDLPSWILDPERCHLAGVGKNNCTFQFPVGYQWNAHPRGKLLGTPRARRLFRQQFQKIHIPNFASCGGGPGDATAIRVCRLGGQGQPQPCFIDDDWPKRMRALCRQPRVPLSVQRWPHDDATMDDRRWTIAAHSSVNETYISRPSR